MQITGAVQPQFELKLQAAADPDGKQIPVEASFEERKKR
jgi:hypothetical protein